MIRTEWILALVALSFIRDSVAAPPRLAAHNHTYADVTVGSTVILPCKQHSKTPGTQVIWLDPHGKPVTFGDRRFLLDDRFSVQRPLEHDWNLQISSTRIRDSGEYKCLLSKPPTHEKIVHLNVRSRDVVTTPRVTTTTPATEVTTTATNEVVNISAPVGGSVELPCMLDTQTGRYIVKWLSGSSSYPISVGAFMYTADTRFSLDIPSEKEWNLQIRGITTDDAGTYTCEINSDPVVKRVAILEVLAADDVTALTTPATTTTEATTTTAKNEVVQVDVSIEGMAVLPCVMDTEGGKYKVAWLVGTLPVPLTIGESTFTSDDRIAVGRPSENDWYLQIQNVKFTDSGRYTCRLSSDPVVLKYFELNVQAKEDIPEDNSFDTIDVAVGSALHLWCNTSAIGHDWFYEGVAIDPNSPSWRKVEMNSATIGRNSYNVLSFDAVEMGDSGTYVCRPSNLKLHAYKVTVINEPSTTTAPVTGTPIQQVHIHAKVGDTVELPCEMNTNNGMWKVVWTDQWSTLISLDTRRIIDDSRFSIATPDSNTWSLEISDLKGEDSGNYSCQMNTNPLTQKFVALTVEEPSTTTAPVTTSSIQQVHIHAKVGDTVDLPCEMDTNNGMWKVVWSDQWSTLISLDTRRIIDDSRFSILKPDSNTWSVEISDLKVEDSGNYSCQMNTNPLTQKFVALTVEGPSTTTTTVQQVHIHANVGDRVELPCEMDTNYGRWTVMWGDQPSSTLISKEYGITIDDRRFSIVKPYPPNKWNTNWNLVISDLIEEDSGTYTCMMNTIPPRIKVVALTVEEPITTHKEYTTLTKEAPTPPIVVTRQPIGVTTISTRSTTTPPIVTTLPTTVTEAPILIEGANANVTAKVGGTIALQCVDTEGGNPEIFYVGWGRDDGSILSNHSILRIDHVTLEDRGTYLCIDYQSYIAIKTVDLSVEVSNQVRIQQIGPRSAIVGLTSAVEYNKTTIHTVRIYDTRYLDEPAYEVKLRGGMAMIGHLYPTNEYKMLLITDELLKTVSPTFRGFPDFIVVPLFSLQTRASTALVLNDAIGDVYEVRGPLKKTKGAEPKFITIEKNTDNIVINLSSFHRVKVSSYKKSPCPKKKCGMLKLFSYKLNGAMKHQTSLLFADDLDFMWAKAHL